MDLPATANPTRLPARRKLILQDGLIFLVLSSISVVLFSLTLLLFRSFGRHREQLAVHWTAQGETDLRSGHPETAVAALRTALNYRDNLPTELLLAQALAAAGHTEEATNYFLNLRETRPGDGFINLQLARLYRQQGDHQLAVDNYQASIFGGWSGDGAVRRRDVRLELASYFAEQGDRPAARDELLTTAGNVPETPAGDTLIADRLQTFGYGQDALNFYTRALKLQPRNRDTLATAGRIAYSLGQYDTAARLLEAALVARPNRGPGSQALSSQDEQQLASLLGDARRVPELTLSRTLPAAERAQHLLLAAKIAQTRLATCLASSPATPPVTAPSLSAPPPPSPNLLILRSRWLAAAHQLTQRTLERDAALEDATAQLIDDTETQTVGPCGAPHGDDALLLRLAHP